MPAMQPVNGVVKITFHHSIGSETDTSWHIFFNPGTAPTQAQLQAAVDAASNTWGSVMPAVTGTEATLTYVKGVDLSSPQGPVAINSTAHAGTRTGGATPASTAMLINWTIARRYRGGKPRAYVPAGVASDLATPQTWSAGFISAFGGAYTQVAVAINNSFKTWAPGCVQCSVSYFNGGTWVNNPSGRPIWKPTPRIPPKVDTVVANQYSATVGSQRRRVRPG